MAGGRDGRFGCKTKKRPRRDPAAQPPGKPAASGLARRRSLLYALFILIGLAAVTALALAIGNWQQLAPTDGTTAVRSTSPVDESLAAAVPATAFARRSTVKAGVNDAMVQLNPLYAEGDGEQDAVSLIFEALIQIDEYGQPSGQLANSWSFDAATRILTVELRSDHTFRDGRVVNSGDVLFTYQCLLSDSYDGPLKGKLADLVSVAAGETPQRIAFQMADWVEKPDYRLLTIGILKADAYACPLDRVFEIRDKRLPPEGSGAFFQTAWTENRVVLNLRPGYGGQVRTVELLQVRSEDKYGLLLKGGLDIVRNLFDSRMQQRSESLPGYTFTPIDTSVANYLLVNPRPLPSSMIQRPSQRLAVLLTVAGNPLSALQQDALSELQSRVLVLHYFQGIESNVLYDNRELAETLAMPLRQAGLTVELAAENWPELAERAANNDYDLLLLPATANSRLPELSVLLRDPVQPGASALIASYRSEVFITCNRLARLTINPLGHPYAAAAGTWTDRIENIQILNPDGSVAEEDAP